MLLFSFYCLDSWGDELGSMNVGMIGDSRRDVGLVSWGPCQTPTLWFLVRRERERMEFKPKQFWTVKAVLDAGDGLLFEAESRRYWERREAEKMLEDARNCDALVKSYVEEESRVQRPLPTRTDEMLRDLTRITGAPASKLLDIAEKLYSEGHISYPRTDTNVYGRGFDFSKPLSEACKGLGISVRGLPMPRQGGRDDGAHTPIYPLTPPRSRKGLEWILWEYVARRFLANAFYGDAVRMEQKATITIGPLELSAKGSKTIQPGFYKIYHYFRPKENPIPRMRPGQSLRVVKIWIHSGMTSPPERLTEDELLRLMEEHGIGTDATRATYPKLIIDRGYAVKRGRKIIPTKLGMSLIEALETVDTSLTTPETRRRVEEYMEMIEKGEISYEEALDKSLKTYKQLYSKLEEKIWDVARKIVEGIKSDEKTST